MQKPGSPQQSSAHWTEALAHGACEGRKGVGGGGLTLGRGSKGRGTVGRVCLMSMWLGLCVGPVSTV